jgi:hypothetical protein
MQYSHLKRENHQMEKKKNAPRHRAFKRRGLPEFLEQTTSAHERTRNNFYALIVLRLS